MPRDDLIKANLPLVRSVARQFGPLSHDQDVIQCGMIGLWEATEKWDGERDFKPFAKVCIRNAIIDHLRKELRWQRGAEVLEDVGAEDERDLIKAIKTAFPAGSAERDILLSLLGGTPKQDIADRYGVSRRAITKIAAAAWYKLER